jgi:hypothetical protein
MTIHNLAFQGSVPRDVLGPIGLPPNAWSIDGVDWQRERHSYAGASHGFTVEVTTGRRSGAAPWTMLVVKEYWRSGSGEEMKSHQWAHIETGRRADVVDWLERQERRLEGA